MLALACALVLAGSAVVDSSGAPAIESTIVLEDPPVSPALDGALLQVERQDGVFLEGKARVVSSALLFVGTDEVSVADVKRIRTLEPAGQPVAQGARVEAWTSAGKSFRGDAIEISAREIAVRSEDGGGTTRLRWIALSKVDILSPRSEPIAAEDPGPPDVKSFGILPVAVFQPQPVYPVTARVYNLEGKVVLEIVVGPEGRVISIRILKSQPPFDDPSIAAVRRWRYRPVLLNGKAITWKSRVNLNFSLRDGSGRVGRRRSPPGKFGSAGIIEMGGGLGLANNSVRERVAGTTATTSSTEIDARLFAGYFVADAIEVSGGIGIRHIANDYFDSSAESADELGADLTGGYYFATGSYGARVGPEATVLVFRRASRKEAINGTAATFDTDGPGIGLGVMAKFPINASCLISTGVGFYEERASVRLHNGSLGSRGTATDTAFRTSIRFSAFF